MVMETKPSPVKIDAAFDALQNFTGEMSVLRLGLVVKQHELDTLLRAGCYGAEF
jgi:hypothetical protein